MNEYDDLNDLDDVFGPLRSVARPAELSQESAMVDLMVNAHRTAEGKHMFTSRRARIATLIAAGVLGFGGMAAASPSLGGGSSEPTEAVAEEPTPEPVEEEKIEPVEEPTPEPVEAVEPVEEPTPEPVEEPTPEPVEEEKMAEEPDVATLEDDPSTDFNEEFCEPGNHGKTVSAVARGLFDPEGLYEAKVPLTVKVAAQSSCGKTAPGGEATESETEVEIESEDSDTEDSDDAELEEAEEPKVKAERPGNGGGPGNDNGKSNGNGNGNGKRGG